MKGLVVIQVGIIGEETRVALHEHVIVYTLLVLVGGEVVGITLLVMKIEQIRLLIHKLRLLIRVISIDIILSEINIGFSCAFLINREVSLHL